MIPNGRAWRGALPSTVRRTVLVLGLVILAGGGSHASYQLFDDFEDESLGPIGAQDGWSSSGGDNRVVPDPDGLANQVLYVPSESSILRKALAAEGLGVPDGTARLLFLRIRVGNKQTFSVGLSPGSFPSEYSDFATEIGMANSTQNLDLRAWDDEEGNYELLTQLQPDRWYNLWVLVDTAADRYRVWLHDRDGAPATDADRLAAPDGDDSFVFRSGRNSDLLTFYVKTSGGGSGMNFGPVYFDDIHLELTADPNLSNPAGGFAGAVVSGLTIGADTERLSWEPLDGAAFYDVVRGDLQQLKATGGRFDAALVGCLADDTGMPTVRDEEIPAAGGGTFYVVRGVTAGAFAGSYESGGPGQVNPRDAPIAAAPVACP